MEHLIVSHGKDMFGALPVNIRLGWDEEFHTKGRLLTLSNILPERNWQTVTNGPAYCGAESIMAAKRFLSGCPWTPFCNSWNSKRRDSLL